MTGPTKRIVYSWDSNIFLAHFKQEADKPLDDIRAVYEDVESGKADMVVSTIVIAELLDVMSDEVMREMFRAFLRRPNIMLQDVTPRIARRTAKLRAEWRDGNGHETQHRNIKTPDAIIITTALERNASVLHSHEPRVRRHHKSELVEGLEITEPRLFNRQLVLPDLQNDATLDVQPAAIESHPSDNTPLPSDDGNRSLETDSKKIDL